MSTRTVFLPPAPRRESLSFDEYQHKKKTKLVSAKTGLSHQDIEGYHQNNIIRTNKNNNAWGTPPWTASDEKVQLVVALQLWKMVHMSFALFPMDRFEKERFALVLELEKELSLRCVSFINQDDRMVRNGVLTYKLAKKFGYAKILAQVIYSKYRLNKAANTIAADFENILTPCGVRQLANRLCHTARVVFNEQDAPAPKRSGVITQRMLERWREQYRCKDDTKDEGSSKSYQGRLAFKKRRQSNKRINRPLPLSNLEIHELITNGRTALDIAEEYGVHHDTVKRRAARGKRESAGLPPIDRGCKKDIILSMHKDGIPIEEIALEVGKPLAYVDCIIKNFGSEVPCEECDEG